ncbi:uncharacterized protein [Triticum aestivum]|uniref:uncharacterized protein n=1 Tax=Triticum aestivum TaxID=4565 RepID=UPI001D02631A|nr:uncharacterized protein LOC123048456 [Triticum aestivum]
MAGDELVAAEPAECSRWVLMCLLAVVGSTLFVVGTGMFAYVEHVEQLPDLSWFPSPHVAFFISGTHAYKAVACTTRGAAARRAVDRLHYDRRPLQGHWLQRSARASHNPGLLHAVPNHH